MNTATATITLTPIRSWNNFIRFSHTLFSLPFAMAALAYSGKYTPLNIWSVALLLLAMVGARSFGMSLNRIVDKKFDAANPRTKNRELVTGVITPAKAKLFCLFSAVLFVTAAFALSEVCGLLSLPVLAVLALYSFSKRFTAWCHIILGVGLGMAPAAVWFAMTCDAGIIPWLFLLGVAFWVAGFDILYSLLDKEFDVEHSLYSIPAEFGVTKSIWFARSFHSASILIFLTLGSSLHAGISFFVGVVLFAVLLLRQHHTVHAQNLRALEPSFFALSGYASFVFFLGALADVLIH